MKLPRNVGSFDAAARVIAGCALLLVANHGHAAAGYAAGVLLACASTGFCPLWATLRIDTGAQEKACRRAPWPADEEG